MERFCVALFAFCWLSVAPAIGLANEPVGNPPVVGVGEVLSIVAPSLNDCPKDSEKVVLLLDRLDTGLKTIGCDSQTKSISFRLQPSESNPSADATWSKVLGRFWDADAHHEGAWPGQWARSVSVTLTKSKSDGSDSSVVYSGTLRLRVISSCWPWAAALLLGTIGGLICLGRYTGMLRDANSTEAALRRPYSLSRLQMAWWFALIFIAYVVLFFTTLDWPSLSGSTLVLLGISGVASATSAGIDSAPGRIMPATAGFWTDILTDAKGITLARFQMLAWNGAIGAFFLYKVIYNLHIPELDATTLGVLGLSAGAYVSLKVPEKQS
jgi:hypothetical protein